MKITFAGAAGTVTGSRYVVEHEGKRLLVDCGLFQGYNYLRQRNWAPVLVLVPAIMQTGATNAFADDDCGTWQTTQDEA